MSPLPSQKGSTGSIASLNKPNSVPQECISHVQLDYDSQDRWLHKTAQTAKTCNTSLLCVHCALHAKKHTQCSLMPVSYLNLGWAGGDGHQSICPINDLPHGQVMHASQRVSPVHFEGSQLDCHGPRAEPRVVELAVEISCRKQRLVRLLI